uniref:Thiocillin GE2270 n=2 Tax=Streptosporangiaceae TaxID=2004 RepID=THCL_PLARO|nr:RecName: Full=Thiocillin GE2270; AltName: Full=Antibiotic GE2270 [Planobispora rosea]
SCNCVCGFCCSCSP